MFGFTNSGADICTAYPYDRNPQIMEKLMARRLLFVCVLSIFFVLSANAQGSSSTGPAPATAPAADTAKKPPVFRPTKDQITEVQKILVAKKLYSAEPSGKYDDSTREGIKSFQKDNGLKETGTLNRATLEKFGVALTDKQKLIPVSPNSFASADDSKGKTTSKASTSGSTSDGPKRPAPFRANADQITAAQKMLRDGKMLTGGEDGKLDDATREGLGKYQEANSLKVTKTLNAATLQKMGIILTDKQKDQVTAQAAYDSAKKN
jgi:peptidoglycan hydrolase-like protein with peptidoglycan-binding domain